MTTRIYAVRLRDSDTVRLVEATTSAQALRHVAEKTFEVAVAKPKDVAQQMARGVALESTGDE